jgi:PAS domain S-box-containing protein
LLSFTTLLAAEVDQLGRAAVCGSADAVIYSDRDGLIRLWNAGAERVFGYSSEEALGRSLDLIIPEKQRERHWTGYRRVMQTGKTRYGEGDLLAVPSVRKDGARISLEFTIAPIHDLQGHIQGLLAIVRDVTKRFEELRALRHEMSRLRRPD